MPIATIIVGSIVGGGAIVLANAGIPRFNGVAYPLPSEPMTTIMRPIIAAPPRRPASAPPTPTRVAIAIMPPGLASLLPDALRVITVPFGHEEVVRDLVELQGGGPPALSAPVGSVRGANQVR